MAENMSTMSRYDPMLVEYLENLISEKFQVPKQFNRMHMDLEKHWVTYLTTGKKKYVGKLSTGKRDMKGMEAIKRDTIPYAANLQLEFFDHVIEDKWTGEQLREWLLEKKEEVLNGKVPLDQLYLYKKMTKAPESFAAFKNGAKLPAHVQVFLDAKVKCKLEVGQYIPMLITNGSPIEAVHPDLYTGDPEIDLIYYWNSRIYALIQRVLVVSYPEIDWRELEEETKDQKERRLKREALARERALKKQEKELQKLAKNGKRRIHNAVREEHKIDENQLEFKFMEEI